MTAFVACCGRWPRWSCALAGLILSIASTAVPHAARAEAAAPTGSMREPITVHLDQARVIKLPERTATLVVGNPLIADISVQPGNILVITAKSHGMTNLVVLDRAGTTLAEHPIQVLAPADHVVVLYRGIERESYSCTESCERRIALGDSAMYFNTTINQTGILNTLAQRPPPR